MYMVWPTLESRTAKDHIRSDRGTPHTMASLSKNASAQARTYARKHTQADGQIENIIPQWPIIWEVASFLACTTRSA